MLKSERRIPPFFESATAVNDHVQSSMRKAKKPGHANLMSEKTSLPRPHPFLPLFAPSSVLTSSISPTRWRGFKA
eukprot:8955205-Pyramimonas_sp.AAC.1